MVGADYVTQIGKGFQVPIRQTAPNRRRRAYAPGTMGASYGKLTPGHEEAIYRLRKERNSSGRPRTGTEIRDALARGVDGEPPVSISADRALKVARKLIDERDELYSVDVQKRAPREGLQLLNKRLMVLADKETARLERAERQGRLDANKLGKLAGALAKIHALQDRLERPDDPQGGGGPTGKKDDSSAGAVSSPFASRLVGGGDEGTAAPAREGTGDEASASAEQRPPIADEVMAGAQA